MLYAYMRVSTPHQTLENQHYALLKFADQRGLRIDAWVTESSSGAKAYTERALGQLLAQLRPQDTLLVAEISRLGRRLLDILQILHRLMDIQVTLISVKEGLEVGNQTSSRLTLLANSYAANANAAKGAARRFWGRGPVNHATTRTRLMAGATRLCWRGVFAKPWSRDRRKSNTRTPWESVPSMPARGAY